jgi:hypothetical protein
MKKIFLTGIAGCVLLLSSCDLLSLFNSPSSSSGLTQDELVAGLKDALVLGSKTAAFTLRDTSGAVNTLGEVTGYLADSLVKILLPPDAEKAFTTVNGLANNDAGKLLLSVAGVDLSGYRDAMIRGLNRGAEHAAGLSVDVFTAAITGMTFSSARDILFGADSAGATNYLKTTTSGVLTSGFKPIIDTTFSSVNVSAFGMQYTVKGVWTEFASKFNSVAGQYYQLKVNSTSSNPITASLAGASLLSLQAAGISSVDSVNTNLVDYATGKALQGLFFMVGKQELKIRRDPVGALTAAGDFITTTVSDLIRKVFTSSAS